MTLEISWKHRACIQWNMLKKSNEISFGHRQHMETYESSFLNNFNLRITYTWAKCMPRAYASERHVGKHPKGWIFFKSPNQTLKSPFPNSRILMSKWCIHQVSNLSTRPAKNWSILMTLANILAAQTRRCWHNIQLPSSNQQNVK